MVPVFLFVETRGQAGEWERLQQNLERLQMCPDWRLVAQGHRWQAEWKLASCVIDERSLIGFLWSVLSWKWGQKLGKQVVMNQVLAVGGYYGGG